MPTAKAKVTRGAVLDMVIKPSSLREELVMSLRTIVSIAAAIIIGIAGTVTVSTDASAAPAGTTRLHHHKHHHRHTVHHSGQVRH